MDEEISGLSTCGDGFVEDVRGWVCGWKREVNTGSEGYLGGGRGCGVWVLELTRSSRVYPWSMAEVREWNW